MEKAQTIYCGSAKAIPTKHGEMLAVSFGPKDLETLLANKNEKGWINLNISERKEIGKYGETHSITVNNWKPNQDEEKTSQFTSKISLEDIPF